MFKYSKAAAELAVTSLVLAGVAAAGTGAATADTGTGCSQTANATRNAGWSGAWINHTYAKSVSAATFAAGTIVTYTDVVGTTSIGNPYVNGIYDYPPTGFGTPVKATVTAYHLGQGQVAEDVTPSPNTSTSSGQVGWGVHSTGWFVNSGNPVTLTISYKIPTTVQDGQQITSGGMGADGTVGVGNDIPEVGVCFTSRAQNPGEALLGSADANGVGSAANQLSSTGSVTDGITQIIKNLLPGS
ncbi:hypothetical protein [Nocardia stercoris]|uniref:Secreted protein n=1 Tax=Nocardia stercoris TaxID=2483361 RepID=A0A3M2KYE9_9NOCA|nr:hypothetical protein [Nocardia stercoris]RMI30492.1 hypothetical protein EBN03_20600 [Nocardia stercoris]